MAPVGGSVDSPLSPQQTTAFHSTLAVCLCLSSFVAPIQAVSSDVLVLLLHFADCPDGPTDAAGAVVDGGTIARAEAKGIDFGQYLENNDAYNFFKELGDGLLITGPTGTNVADVAFLLVGKGAALP